MAEMTMCTEWSFEAGQQAVFSLLDEPPEWKEWWTAWGDVRERSAGDENGIGRRFEGAMRAPMGHSLRADLVVEEREVPTHLKWSIDGDLEGTMSLHFERVGEKVDVTMFYEVTPKKWWMAWLLPLAKPAFYRDYDRAMRRCAEGLAETVGGLLVSHATTTRQAAEDRWSETLAKAA